MDGINLDGVRKICRDCRLLDYLAQHLNFSIEDGTHTLHIESFSDNECNYDTIQLELPLYIYDDFYEWLEED